MAVLMTPPFLQFFDANGDVLAGGKVNTYTATGTFSTRKATYTTEAGDVEHPNPVILDSAGRPSTGNGSIWLTGTYDFVVTDANDVEVETTLNVTAFSALPSASDAYFETFSGTGSQTAFTTSDDLGADEKAIFVWVNEGLKEAVTNGMFATDSGWTKGTGWSIGSGVATAAGGTSTAIEQTAAIALVEGQAYSITYTITRSAGTLTPSIGGTDGTPQNATGTYTEVIVAGSDQTLAFTGSGFTGTLDNISITQAVSSGYVIQSPNTYTIDGTTLTFSTAPALGTNNIYVSAPSLLVGAASSAAADAASSAAAATASEASASTSASSASTSASTATTKAAEAVVSSSNAQTFASQFSTYETSVYQAPYNADSTGATGNATQLQNALDDLETDGGGVASFRAGLLNVNAPVNLNRHTTVQGVYDERAFNNRQATNNATGISGGAPNTGLHITDTTNTGSTAGADATFTFDSNSGGLKNSLVAYPNQTLVSTTPITEYAPTFGFAGNRIGFTLQNLQFINPYIVLKMEGQGNGFGLIENVQTRPFKIGFWLDRVNEHTTFNNMSHWTWGGTDDAILDRHLNDTVIEYYCGFIDAVTFHNVSSYDRKTTFHLYNNGSGSPWMNVSDCNIDNNIKPIVIEDANIANFVNMILVGDNEETEDGNAGIEITADFSDDSGRVNFLNVDIFNTSHGVINRATTGTFNFSNISIKTDISATGAGRYDENAVRGAAFIDEGAGAINKISNLARGGRQTWEGIFADNNTIIDGITLPDRETEITSLSGWDTGASWDDKANWTNNTNITNITDGLQFDLTNTIATSVFSLPALFRNEKMFILEFEVEQNFATSTTPAATITPAAAEGLITITANASVFSSSDVDKFITGNSGEARIVTYNSATEVLVSVLEPFANTNPITTTNWSLEDRADVESGCTFGVSVGVGANVITKHLDNSFVPRWNNKTKLIFPVIVPDGSAYISITFGGQTTGTAVMNLTNMKMYRPSRESITATFLDAIYGTDRYSTALGKFFDIENGKYKILSNGGIPTAGTFEAGDTIFNTSNGEKFLCTVGGASSTWIDISQKEQIKGSTAVNFPALADGASQTVTDTVTGAEPSDFVTISTNIDRQATSLEGYISASNTITYLHTNNTGSSVDLALGDIFYIVQKR